MAKRRLQGTGYVIQKDPPSRGYEADWIGVDANGLVIVEAKGTYDKGVSTWRGPNRWPQILETAVAQAGRTAVFAEHPYRKLPAKRWAIASRWGTERNQLEPTLLAWDPEDEKLGDNDHQQLSRILLNADLDGTLRGLGHANAAEVLGTSKLRLPVPGVLRIRVGDQEFEPGFAAAVGPFGVQPLRGENDIVRVEQFLELNPSFAVASLSSRYAAAISQRPYRTIEEYRIAGEGSATGQSKGDIAFLGPFERERIHGERSAKSAGLTVAWPSTGQETILAYD